MRLLDLSGNLLARSLRSVALILILGSASVARAQTPGAALADHPSHPTSHLATLRGRAVYDDTGLPVRHATITLMNPESPEDERPSIISDGHGDFVVKDLAPGDYLVSVGAVDAIAFERLKVIVTMPEMMKLEQGSAADQAAASEKVQTESRRLANSLLPRISFTGREDSRVEVRAKRGGVISGKVSYADGSPAANLNVELFSRQGGSYSPVLLEPIHAGIELKPVKTDDLGQYRIIGLLPGEYFLSATEPSANKGDEFSFEVQSLLITYYPSVTELEEARAIPVKLARETSGVDVVLAERELRTLAGTLKTRRGDKPVAGARISLYPKDAARKPPATGNMLYAESDREGRWAFHEIPDGRYVIQFAPELGANEAWSSDDAARRQNFVESKQELTVAGDTSDLAIKVAAGGRLSGKVVVEGDQKLPGVHLSLRNVNGEPLLHGQAFGTRPDFSFAVSGVVSEGLEIRADAPIPGYQTKSITLNGAPLRQPFKVADGDDISGIVIVIAPMR